VNQRRAPLALDALIEIVGRDRFESASEGAWTTGQGTDVPHELSDRLWFEGNESLSVRLAVAFELYRRMPCYANLMYIPYKDLDSAQRESFWDEYRSLLGDERGPIADPVAYSLWVDYFEDRATVQESWREVAGPQEPRISRLRRVLAASGPVPWALKFPIYNRELADARLHEPIAEGLFGSCFDIYGDLERLGALQLLGRLRVSEDYTGVGPLRVALSDPKLPSSGAERRQRYADYKRRSGAT
jgi:hypothetical protein